MMAIFRFFFLAFSVLSFTVSGLAQFNTPTINGSISAGEYGTHTDGQNQQGNGSQTWYMTWDNTNLYLAIASANTAEAGVLYLDKDPLTPINSGSNSNGTNVGFNYDGTSFAALQFRADLVVYFKDSYREYRTADGSNGWSSSTSGFGSYSSAGGTVRELSIPWSAIGGRPGSFAWFGYVTSSGGFVYGQMPTENAGGSIGTSARYVRYYIANSTSDGASIKPFSRNSYVFNSSSDVSGFGSISVYDFTMNSAGRSLTRSSDASAWTITGALTVNDGTLSFGGTTGAATVAGGVAIGSGGTLNLSSASGGDLNLGGNFSNSGTFNVSNRAVGFNGSSAQSITGATTFDFVSLNNAAGLTLNNNITINQTLTLTAGNITLGSNNLTIGSSGSISGATSAKHIITNGSGFLVRNGVGASNVSFPVGTGSSYNPVIINNSGTSDNFSVSVKGSFDTAPNDPNTTLTRQWTINESITGGSNAAVTLQFNGSDPAGTFFSHGNPTMFIGRFPAGGPWLSTAATKGGSDPYTVSATFTGFSLFAVGVDAAALPVQLAAFTGAYINATSVRLNWRTVSELNNYGFYVERRRANETGWSEVPGSFVPGRGTTSIPQEYSYTDNTALGGALSYRLRQVDLDGSVNYSERIVVDSPTSVKEHAPMQFALLQNYPNPFNPSTDIKFSVAKPGRATLTVFNSLGQLVSTLYDETAEAGQYYTVRFAAENLSSGTYFYRLQSGDRAEMKKLVIMK